ncbi:flagellar basal body FlaE [Candidatus Koribacter versatilis Ellin345]|uniref:Flagellar hook protein FlgE n=1 Tax=Koribacter versatilis (strain Ellin345) TaxID=204669 RepID=Q1IR53_KORVE|nr:flagellar hook protein FlgE [Candidatus Koribacter versatilis]ABF40647.1 flagellar basal body FlaE [Candidatus Koribacter versatilis Ellin345]
MPMFSIPLSGLTASSTALATIANNLANQNTIGYKQTRALFRDLFYQQIGQTGSGDPIQVGAGTMIGTIDTNFTDGSVSPTGVPTDVAIMGDGFFVAQQNGNDIYTRAGNFKVGADGTLRTQDGAVVLGYQAVDGKVTTGSGLGALNLGQGQVSSPSATTSLQLTTNLNASAKVGDSYNTSLKVYDSLGGVHVVTFTFTKTGTNTWDYDASLPTGEGTVSLPSGSHTLTFDSDGKLTTPSSNINFDLTGLSDGASDMKGVTWKLYDATGGSSMTQMAADSATPATAQDGYGSGMLQNFNIGADGTIEGTFSNGKTSIIGQIAIASFPNVQGLRKVGQNAYVGTLASGQAALGAPGSGGRGTLGGGALELSNVDMATEFSNLIVAQRGYQANAKVITTFDEITQDTINLKR